MITCTLPRLAHDGEALHTQIDLLLDFCTVRSGAVFPTMLPQSTGDQHNRKDEIAGQSIKIVHILRQYRGSFLSSSYAYPNGRSFGRYPLRGRPIVFSPVKVERTMKQDDTGLQILMKSKHGRCAMQEKALRTKASMIATGGTTARKPLS